MQSRFKVYSSFYSSWCNSSCVAVIGWIQGHDHEVEKLPPFSYFFVLPECHTSISEKNLTEQFYPPDRSLTAAEPEPGLCRVRDRSMIFPQRSQSRVGLVRVFIMQDQRALFAQWKTIARLTNHLCWQRDFKKWVTFFWGGKLRGTDNGSMFSCICNGNQAKAWGGWG